MINNLTRLELAELIRQNADSPAGELTAAARKIRDERYGRRIFLRGLIELTNYCKNGCYYCGIRAGNAKIRRYRLTKQQILESCGIGYGLGLRSFVLQGGEDPGLGDKAVCDIIREIRFRYPGCAVTLSLGEKSAESYRAYYDAGADRYLLRHETADAEHYAALHPPGLSLQNRKKCLYMLKNIGFQVGAGFMVGSPFQTFENLADDLLFLKDLQPHMVGIGPFIPHVATPFGEFPAGGAGLTLTMLALTRIMLPDILLPATTALATINNNGRELGFEAGANVVMPNLSPIEVRENYALYNGKLSTGAEAAEGIKILKELITRADYVPDCLRGDHKDFREDSL